MRTLVIDGHGGRLAPVCESLRSSDAPPFEVRVVPALEQGLSALAHEPFDVVLLEVGSRSADELDQLLKAAGDVPVVTVTEPRDEAGHVWVSRGAHASLPLDASPAWVRSVASQAAARPGSTAKAGSTAAIELDRLERRHALLAAFAHRVTHDLKGPVRRIAGLIEWLAEDLEEPGAELAELMLQIGEQARAMQALVAAHLDFAEAGGGALELESVDLEAAFAQAAARLGQRVEIGPLPSLQGDRFWLGQVASSLLECLLPEQAPRAGSDAAAVLVEAVETSGHCEIILTATQPTPATFDPKTPGSPMCALAVERHGGSLWAVAGKSAEPARIHVKFPLALVEARRAA